MKCAVHSTTFHLCCSIRSLSAVGWLRIPFNMLAVFLHVIHLNRERKKKLIWKIISFPFEIWKHCFKNHLFQRRVIRLCWPLAKKVNFCVDDYKYSENLSHLISTYSKVIQEYLNELVPEHRSFHCTHAFLYDEPTIPKAISELIR